jgi:hypothetical protein
MTTSRIGRPSKESGCVLETGGGFAVPDCAAAAPAQAMPARAAIAAGVAQAGRARPPARTVRDGTGDALRWVVIFKLGGQ